MGSRVFRKINEVFQGVISIIYGKDEVCLLCENPEGDKYICSRCNESIKILNLKYTIEKYGVEFTCNSLGVYGLNLKKLILLLKYEKEFEAGKILAIYLADYIKKEFNGKIDMITFIPSSDEAYRKRGFNQCEVLCEYISEIIGIPYVNLMEKQKGGRDQIGLDGTARWENIKDTFLLKVSSQVSNKKVLLVDDVITTGATAFYGAKCIKDGGADEVYILTVAKSRV